MLIPTHFHVLAGLLCALTATEAWNNGQKAGEDFQFLLLAHFWPTSSCVYFENKHEECLVPPEVKGWTIHGLWPSKPGTEGPAYCNNSMKFNYDEIQSLSSRLALKWPSYEKNADKTALWNHEWTKHGTCAYPLPFLRGELKYFNETLNLNDKINITKVLSDSGIVPSDKPQSPGDIFNAVQRGIRKTPNVICIKEKKTGIYHLAEMWFCYDKNLRLMDCPDVATTRNLTSTLYYESERGQGLSSTPNSHYEHCPKDGDIYYKPIPRNQK